MPAETIGCDGRGDRKTLIAVAAMFMAVASPLSAPVAADEAPENQTIQFFHEDYPPYVYRVGDRVVGVIAELTTEILKKAGLRATWRQTNYSRLVREIELGTRPSCATGYSGQRQTRFDFLSSKSIGWFPGAAITIKKSDEHLFSRHTSIDDILRDSALRGAFLNDANYQGITDELMELGRARHLLIGGSDTELGLLVARGRVQFAPINPAQTRHLRENNPSAANLTVFQPTGMRPPRKVGIICSKRIDPDYWKRINQAIGPLQPFEEWMTDHQ